MRQVECLTLRHVEIQTWCPGAVASQRRGSDSDRVVSWTEVGQTNATLGMVHLTRDALVLLGLTRQIKESDIKKFYSVEFQ